MPCLFQRLFMRAKVKKVAEVGGQKTALGNRERLTRQRLRNVVGIGNADGCFFNRYTQWYDQRIVHHAELMACSFYDRKYSSIRSQVLKGLSSGLWNKNLGFGKAFISKQDQEGGE